MSKTRINLIYARARNGVIGRDNELPWHLPEDMAHFKEVTMGAPVLMGRKTWESLSPRFRPLPGRPNVVLTHQAEWQAEGALRAASVEDAMALFPDAPELWVIGGAQIFQAALPLATRIVATELDETFEGDVYAPALDTAEWHEVSSEEHKSAAGLKFRFVTYERR